MAVFDDPMKELEKLQEQLLEQEDWFQRELDSAKRMIGDMPEPRKPQNAEANKSAAFAEAAPVRNYANGYGAKAERKPAVKPENYDQEEYAPKKKGLGGLLILATLETLGILGIAGYWLLYFFG